MYYFNVFSIKQLVTNLMTFWTNMSYFPRLTSIVPWVWGFAFLAQTYLCLHLLCSVSGWEERQVHSRLCAVSENKWDILSLLTFSLNDYLHSADYVSAISQDNFTVQNGSLKMAWKRLLFFYGCISVTISYLFCCLTTETEKYVNKNNIMKNMVVLNRVCVHKE